MNANERELDYCFADRIPAPGTAMAVAPGIKWVRMPLPFALDHINLWLIEDGQTTRLAGQTIAAQSSASTPDRVTAPAAAWTLIDCGISDNISKGHWEEIFDTTLGGAPIHRVLCTHFHPDHLGLADWICRGGARERWTARLWMTLGEYACGRLFSSGAAGTESGGAAAAAHMREHGFADAAALEQIAHRAAYFPRWVPRVPDCFRRLTGGATVHIGEHDWRVIIGYGHSPEHAALYSASAGILIAGDMVLPRISTNVSVTDIEPEGDPLGGFLDSLHAYDALPAETLVLPSHGKPFRGLQTRLRQLRQHHSARLAEVASACAEAPRCAAEIVPMMFPRSLDTHQMTFALGEALAHLHYLWHRGQLDRIADAAGVFRFRPSQH